MKVAKNGEIKGRQLPLVVISHGTGGGITSHIDLALALASSGYVVAAPMHSDNYLDSSSVGSLQYIKGRNSQLTKTIDFMLNQWNGASSIDASKVGAYGFSIGGFTVLTSVGAKPNLKSVAKYCVEHREFVCDMLLDAKSFLLTPDLPVGIDAFSTDPRIKAAVLAAPGLGFTFTEQDGLKNVQIPIQIWQGNQDTLVPFATNSKLISENLPNKAELHLVANAAHTSFLAPCGILKLIPICSDPDQFDRQDFHQQMNSQVLEFYNRQLK
jgi:predicted dienelactone hydrolase